MRQTPVDQAQHVGKQRNTYPPLSESALAADTLAGIRGRAAQLTVARWMLRILRRWPWRCFRWSGVVALVLRRLVRGLEARLQEDRLFVDQFCAGGRVSRVIGPVEPLSRDVAVDRIEIEIKAPRPTNGKEAEHGW